jgi:hypothetical protein
LFCQKFHAPVILIGYNIRTDVSRYQQGCRSLQKRRRRNVDAAFVFLGAALITKFLLEKVK